MRRKERMADFLKYCLVEEIKEVEVVEEVEEVEMVEGGLCCPEPVEGWKGCFFSISPLFRPLVPCPLQPELRKRPGAQVPRAGWKKPRRRSASGGIESTMKQKLSFATAVFT